MNYKRFLELSEMLEEDELKLDSNKERIVDAAVYRLVRSGYIKDGKGTIGYHFEVRQAIEDTELVVISREALKEMLDEIQKSWNLLRERD